MQAPGLYGREIGNLVKAYEDDQKYSGAMDSFDLKLIIFHDLCRKTGVPYDSYSDAFSTMLKGKARTYYYEKVINKGLSFENMCQIIKAHFETEERKQAMISKWNSVSLPDIMKRNEDKSTAECLELLLDQLQQAWE
jgi:hypothetical protein